MSSIDPGFRILSQHSYTRIVFPLQVSKFDLMKLDLDLTANAWIKWNTPSENSQFFDYVESLFPSGNVNKPFHENKNDCLVKTYRLKPLHLMKSAEQVSEWFHKYWFCRVSKESHEYDQLFFKRKFAFSEFKILMFSTGIIFFCIDLVFKPLTSIIEYKRRFGDIKTFFNEIKIFEVFQELTSCDIVPTAFDYQYGNNTARFIAYHAIQFEVNSEIDFDEIQMIGDWSVNSFSLSLDPEISDNLGISLFFNNYVACTQEGFSCISKKCSENDGLLKNMVNLIDNQYLHKNLFIAYMIGIHQYYYYHALQLQLSQINSIREDEKRLGEIQNLIENYVEFQSNFQFINVSQVHALQKAYDYIIEENHISECSDEMENSLFPLNLQMTANQDRKRNENDVKRSKKTQQLETIVKALTFVTASNALLSIIISVARGIADNDKVAYYYSSIIFFSLAIVALVIIFSCQKNKT